MLYIHALKCLLFTVYCLSHFQQFTHATSNIPYAYKFSWGFIFANFTNQWVNAKKNENMYAYGASLLLQAAIHKIKIAKIVRCGAFAKYTSCENLYAYGMQRYDITAYKYSAKVIKNGV